VDEGVRVLVVEDEESIGDVIVDVLGDEGYEVRRARNGREALEVLKRWMPALIVLDLMMPIMDGWAFREEQRRRPDIADVPIVIISGSREVDVKGRDLGAVAAIEKPFDIDFLVSTVEQLTHQAA
jgi:CheY-like chemotaxis protein